MPPTPLPPSDRTSLSSAAAGRTTAAHSQGTRAGPPTRTRSGSQRQPLQLHQPSESDDLETSRVSHVRILPTSLPYVHDQLMEQRERERRARAADRLAEEQARSGSDALEDPHQSGLDGRSLEEQEATAKALKPHSRSIVDLDKLRLEPPEARNAPHQPRKTRKWQFGIRSRNQPYEAMLYLYKAIAAQRGRWEILPAESG